jgi:hypothetical protein
VTVRVSEAESSKIFRRQSLVPIVIDAAEIPKQFHAIQATGLRGWNGSSNQPGQNWRGS